MNATRRPWAGPARVLGPIAAALASAGLWALIPAAALGHAPDPVVGGSRWAQDQVVEYRWKSGQVPPDWMRSAVNQAAADANATSGSRAATFAYDSGGPSTIAYDEPTGCGPNGIACFNRSGAPSSFTMAFRRQGYVFDWGSLRWCQAYSAFPNGCFDVENIALDEFGHVELLGHHANYANLSDYDDAVVQAVSRSKPGSGWNAHAFGRCDVATLQLKYDMPSWSSRYSTCLDLATTLSLSASDTFIPIGTPVTFTATLRVAVKSSYEQLSNNPLAGRTVILQRQAAGTTTWSTVATMGAGPSSGTYTHTATINGTAIWRAVFSTPSNEGVNGSTSAGVAVGVGSCVPPFCPQSATGAGT